MNLLPIYDPGPDEQDIELGAEVAMADATHCNRAATPPWTRMPGRPHGVNLRESPLYVWLGPFGVGDEVVVNGLVTGVIEHVDPYGMVVVPKPPTTRDTQDAGAWVPAIGVRSIAPVRKLPVDRAPYTPPPEPPEVPDESAPMSPPPVQPRRGMMFE